MARKVHIICAKCGSDEVNFVLCDPCVDDPQAVATICCANCKELTSLVEWSEANRRQLIDRRKVQ